MGNKTKLTIYSFQRVSLAIPETVPSELDGCLDILAKYHLRVPKYFDLVVEMTRLFGQTSKVAML